jgi:putative endonuclease
MSKVYHVYIMSSRARATYIGSTSALAKRVAQHRVGYYHGSHSHFYRIHRLVYYELCPTARAMVERERQLKGWTRAKKVALIQSINPAWDDLAADWELPVLPPLRGGRADPSLRSG